MLHQNKIKLGLCVSLVRFFCEGKEMNFFSHDPRSTRIEPTYT